jgi:hypothetical protein
VGAILHATKEVKVEPYETYSSVTVALSVALLLIAAGVAKKQLVWKRPRPLLVRGRRRKR